MNLRVERKWFGKKAIIGELFIDGARECYTLEDIERTGQKIPGATAILAGNYKVIIDFSTRFQRPMPHVLDVPGFEGIRIHSGNTDADTEGCILLGLTKENDDFIGHSKEAFAGFFSKLRIAVAKGEDCRLEIVDMPQQVLGIV